MTWYDDGRGGLVCSVERRINGKTVYGVATINYREVQVNRGKARAALKRVRIKQVKRSLASNRLVFTNVGIRNRPQHLVDKVMRDVECNE